MNLTSNTFLDADFTVFAAISDMTTINKIMDLTQIDLTQDPDFGAGSGNLAFSDVPLEDNGFQVLIRRAYQINDTLAVAKALAGVERPMAASMAGGGLGGGTSALSAAAASAPLMTSVVPEPTSVVLAAFRAGTLRPAPPPLDAHGRYGNTAAARSGDVFELVDRRIEVDRADVVGVRVVAIDHAEVESPPPWLTVLQVVDTGTARVVVVEVEIDPSARAVALHEQLVAAGVGDRVVDDVRVERRAPPETRMSTVSGRRCPTCRCRRAGSRCAFVPLAVTTQCLARRRRSSSPLLRMMTSASCEFAPN